MLKKVYTPLSLTIQSILMLVAGIFLFRHPETAVSTLTGLLQIFLWVAFANCLFQCLARKSNASIIKTLLYLAFAIFLQVIPDSVRISMSLIFGLWMMLQALSKGLSVWQCFATHTRGWILYAVQCALFAVIGIVLLIHPILSSTSLAWALGIYSILSSIFYLLDALREWLGFDGFGKDGKRIRQHIRFKPPVLLSTFLPVRLLRALDDPDEEKEVAMWTQQAAVGKGRVPDLEIFLHISKKTAMGLGHMDIAMDGRTFSYGNYDAESHQLFGAISDGVLMQADRDTYIPFCIDHEKKRLLGYGIVLTEEQKQAIRDKIASFVQDGIPWVPTKEGDEMTEMARLCNATYRKIQHGSFRKYNVLTTNCVAVANMLSGSGGVDLMSPQGIITPGTYCEFLDRQFRRPNSIVISRTVYKEDSDIRS